MVPLSTAMDLIWAIVGYKGKVEFREAEAVKIKTKHDYF